MNPAFGLYSHIRSNRRRTVAVFIGLFALVYLVGYAGCLIYVALMRQELTYGLPVGEGVANLMRAALPVLWIAAPFITVGIAIWMVIGYFGHQFLIDTVTGGRTLSKAEDPELWNMLENLCISRGLPMPKLKIMDDEAMNAFASGMNERQYAVTVTRGLRQALDKRELEAVLAHELTHIRNGDVSLMVMAVIIAGIAGFFGELILRLFRFGGSSSGRPVRVSTGSSGGGSGNKKGGGGGAVMIAIIIAIAIMILAWLLSGMLRFFLSRTREFLADAGAVELTKDPEGLINALRKISGKAEIQGVPSAIMELCFENHKQGIFDIFATHPPIDDRIDALVNHAGAQSPA